MKVTASLCNENKIVNGNVVFNSNSVSGRVILSSKVVKVKVSETIVWRVPEDLLNEIETIKNERYVGTQIIEW